MLLGLQEVSSASASAGLSCQRAFTSETRGFHAVPPTLLNDSPHHPKEPCFIRAPGRELSPTDPAQGNYLPPSLGDSAWRDTILESPTESQGQLWCR